MYKPALNAMLCLYQLNYTMGYGIPIPNRFRKRSSLSMFQPDVETCYTSEEAIALAKIGKLPMSHTEAGYSYFSDQRELLKPLRRSEFNFDQSEIADNPLFSEVMPAQEEMLERKGKLLDDLMKLECGTFQRKAHDSRIKYDIELKKMSMF